jgi:hypothetical protein
MRKILQTLHCDAEVDEIAAETTERTSHHVRYVGTYVRTYEIVYLQVRQSMYNVHIYIYILSQTTYIIQCIIQSIYDI